MPTSRPACCPADPVPPASASPVPRSNAAQNTSRVAPKPPIIAPNTTSTFINTNANSPAAVSSLNASPRNSRPRIFAGSLLASWPKRAGYLHQAGQRADAAAQERGDGSRRARQQQPAGGAQQRDASLYHDNPECGPARLAKPLIQIAHKQTVCP